MKNRLGQTTNAANSDMERYFKRINQLEIKINNTLTDVETIGGKLNRNIERITNDLKKSKSIKMEVN